MSEADIEAENKKRLADAEALFRKMKDSPEYKAALFQFAGGKPLDDVDLDYDIDREQLAQDRETARYIVELLS